MGSYTETIETVLEVFHEDVENQDLLKITLYVELLKSHNLLEHPLLYGGRTFFQLASSRQKLDWMSVLHMAGADINPANSHGFTPLIEACRHGIQPTTEWLIENGADLETRDVMGWTALMHACEQKGGGPVIDMLIKAGANPHVRDEDGWCPLTILEQRRDTEGAKKMRDYISVYSTQEMENGGIEYDR